MAWVYLIAAGLFEVGWPIGLKWAQDPRKLIIGVVMAIGCLIVSGVLLYLAQREIALGTAYGAKSTTLAVTTSTRARGACDGPSSPLQPDRSPLDSRAAPVAATANDAPFRIWRMLPQPRLRPSKERAVLIVAKFTLFWAL